MSAVPPSSRPSSFDWPWFHSQLVVEHSLIEAILSRALAPSAGIGERANVVDGGWRSGESIAYWPEAAHTLEALRECLATKGLRAWAVVHRGDGSYHNWHRHDGTHWRCSGVLYLTNGGARTLFRHDGKILRSAPALGRVITFPSKIEHATERHYGPPRITVAFNVAP